MSGPKNDGGDAFDDFFGDPTPSGRMGPASTGPSGAPFAEHPDDEPTQDVELRRRDEATQAVTPAPVITPEPTPQGAVPEGWWEPDQTPAPATTSQSSTWNATPAPTPQQPPHRRGLSPMALAAMLVGGVLLGGLCVGGAVWFTGNPDKPVAQSTTITETSSPQETTTSTSQPTTSSSSSTSSTSSSSPPKRSGTLPAGITKCAGPRQGVAAGRGTEVTSCAFAGAVRDAYVREKPKGGNASLEVRSPVTNKNYTMTCTGAEVTTCVGGNNAVVVLY
jgi:hypothetical protein